MNKVKGNWQIIVTVALLAGFGVVVWYLLLTAKGTEEIVWQRRLYVAAGLEALVFTAVGWLFGREVSRAAVATAQQDAADAKKDAADARSEARQRTGEAAQAKIEAAEERTKAETTAAVVECIAQGDAGRSAGVSREAAMGDAPSGAMTPVDLQALFRRLYPQRPSSDG